MRKFLSVFLALAVCLSFAACSTLLPAPTNATAPQGTIPPTQTPAIKEDVVILYTNDIHTYIDGPIRYDVIAALKDKLVNHYGAGNVILADAGDAIQGTAYGSMDEGMTIVSLMNKAGYDVATLGNHEFDYGMDRTMAVIDAARYTYISCNFYHEKNGPSTHDVLPASFLFDTPGGMKVAFVGITTPESFTKSTPAYFQDDSGNYIYGIAGGEDGAALYQAVQSAVNHIDDADVVIALGHLGTDASSRPWTSEDVIANVSGLDAFIDGHSHTEIAGKEVADKDGNPVILTQTGEYFGNIGMMLIDGETGAIETDLITYSEITETVQDESGNPILNDDGEEETQVVGYEFVSELYDSPDWLSDEETSAIQDAWMEEIDAKLGQKIGQTDLILDNYDGETRIVRSQETNTGDFCADALYYLFDDMGLDVDVAIMNGGGIRNKAVTGELTYKVAKSIHTFGNVACLQTITGQQLKDALEWGARSAGSNELGGFLQVAGITYKIDTEWPVSIQADEKGVWTGGPTGGYRVHDIQVYNKASQAYEPIDLNASYNLAGYNYTLRDLGDGFNMFTGAVNVLDYVMEDYMVLANYIQGFDGGIVGADNSPLAAKYPGMLLNYETIYGSGRIMMEAAEH